MRYSYSRKQKQLKLGRRTLCQKYVELTTWPPLTLHMTSKNLGEWCVYDAFQGEPRNKRIDFDLIKNHCKSLSYRYDHGPN